MLYGLILRLRHLAYDKGWKEVFKASLPTICVGNITVGGTGKTPHVELILRSLMQSQDWAFSRLGVLSRGYKRKSKGFQLVGAEATASSVGDEPLQIARKFPFALVAVDKDRVEGCKRLQEQGAQIIILDDAFQYRRLQAGLNIVLVDYHHPVFEDKLLPWGRLRDLPSRLRKAQIVVVSKCPAYLEEQEREQWRKRLQLKDGQKLYFTTLSYDKVEPVFGEEADGRYTYAPRLVLVSGIANDAPLQKYLSDQYKLVRRIAFPDHHRFTKADMRTLEKAVQETPTACLMTTEKDAQRLRDVPGISPALRQRLFYVPVRASFLSPEEEADFQETLNLSL